MVSREILFKAKTTKKQNGEFNNIWVYGDLIKSGGKYYIHPHGNRVVVDGELGKIIIMHEVDSNTICRYTGLTDKNGKKIWRMILSRLANLVEMMETGIIFRGLMYFLSSGIMAVLLCSTIGGDLIYMKIKKNTKLSATFLTILNY